MADFIFDLAWLSIFSKSFMLPSKNCIYFLRQNYGCLWKESPIWVHYERKYFNNEITLALSNWFFGLCCLTHVMPLVSFDNPWKHQKTKDFLMFSKGYEGDQWYEMGWWNLLEENHHIWVQPINDSSELN